MFLLLWLLATSSLAFPSGHHSSHVPNLGINSTPEPVPDRHTESYYTETTVLPPLKKRYAVTRAIADGHFTREEQSWLYKTSLTDVSTAGLKDTTTALKELFGKNHVPWVISGGWALILYGESQRTTPDIDIVVQTTMPELRKLLEADKRFIIPGADWWPDNAHLQVYFKNQDRYYDVDMIIAGQKNSVKDLASITHFTSMIDKGAALSVPVIQISPLFISKVFGLASNKRKKHDQDIKDLSYLVETHYGDLLNMRTRLSLQNRQLVINYFTQYHSPLLAKVKKLLNV
ncbi:hypothetical protein CGRA01v4_03532 [Colletotrichum graminicola]|nr:hypothetical protein CGRA01v4_03532 [Colletotrichum graminicola]